MAKKKRKPRARRKQVIPSQPDAIPYSKYRVEWMDILSDSGWATDKEFERMKLAYPVNEGWLFSKDRYTIKMIRSSEADPRIHYPTGIYRPINNEKELFLYNYFKDRIVLE